MTPLATESATKLKTVYDVLDFVQPSLGTVKLAWPTEQLETLTSGGMESEFCSPPRAPLALVSVEPEYGELRLAEARKAAKPTRILRIPRLEGLDHHDPVLTSTVRDMLRKLWAIVVSRAMQARFPLRRTIVSVFRDPEEEQPRALLRLFVEANAVQAIAFWDSLEKDLQDWLGGLDEYLRLSFLGTISLRVHWS